MKVVVNGTNDQVGKELAEQMVADLDSIGYKASTQLLGSGPQYAFVQNSANSSKWNVAWSAWYQDYPAPSDFLNVLLGCGTIHPNSDASPNIAAFCNKGINSKILQAEADGATNPSEAASLWTAVDHEDTQQAPWVDCTTRSRSTSCPRASTAISGTRSGTSSSTSSGCRSKYGMHLNHD